jgi:hypothetical protein
MGCTRGQNDDVKRLGQAISAFKGANPGVKVSCAAPSFRSTSI